MSGWFERTKFILSSPFHYLDFYICLPLYTVFFLSGLLPSLYFTVIFNSAFSWEMARINPDRSHIPFTQLSLIVIPAVTVVQEQSLEIDIGPIHRPYPNTYLCFCIYIYSPMRMQFYHVRIHVTITTVKIKNCFITKILHTTPL